MLTRQKQTLTRLIVGITAMACFGVAGVSTAYGQSAKESCQALGEACLLYMRPSADIDDRSYRMTDYDIDERKDYVIMKTEFRWYGAILGTPYDSTIKIYIEEKGEKPYITDIVYRDDCPTPIVNEEEVLIRLLNRHLGHR